MKRFFVFALTLLFATSCLVLTNADAYNWGESNDWFFDDTVYGSVYITTDFDNTTETASLYYSFYVSNDGPGGVKMYTTATMGLYWNGGSVVPDPKEDTAIVGANNSGSIYEDWVFSLRNKRPGQGYMWAEGALDIRHLPTNVKVSLSPSAQASTSFDILGF